MSQSSKQHVPVAEEFEHTAEFDLRALPLTVRDARHTVRRHLQDWQVAEECIDVAMLLTSEVVTNAARHAPPPIHLVVRHGRPGVRIEVGDSRPSLDRRVGRDLDDHGGRGLWLVQRMSARWGHHQFRHGKVVWFDIETPQEA